MTAAVDIAAIERATAEAVSPQRVTEVDGWLVARDPGTIGRAHSAAPLRHDLDAGGIPRIEDLYREAGLSPVFRVADVGGLAAVHAVLAERGYRPEQPTLVKTGGISAMIAKARGAPAPVAPSPGASWAEVFTAEGFDPVDGASRVQALTRAPDALYAAVEEGGVALGVGMMAFGEGWASVHGMRTRADRRGEGFAGRVLAGLAGAAQARGVEPVFLQVEEGNPARRLYRAFGFTPAWRYFYWRRRA